MKFKGKRRNEMPPHIFSVADNAYHNMLQGELVVWNCKLGTAVYHYVDIQRSGEEILKFSKKVWSYF